INPRSWATIMTLRTKGERGDQCSFMDRPPPRWRDPVMPACRLRASAGMSAKDCRTAWYATSAMNATVPSAPQTCPNFGFAALSGALPAHCVESGIEFLTCLGERIGGPLAGTREIEAVVAAFPRTGVKAHTAQGLGKLRIFLAAIGTNHDNTCSRLYLRNAI